MIYGYAESKRDARNMKILLVGYAIFSIAFVVEQSDPPYLLILGGQILQFLGICSVVYALFGLIKLKNTTVSYVKFILTLLIVWFYFLVVWSFRLDFDFIKKMFFGGDGSLFTYLVPLVVLFHQKVLFLKSTINTIVILGLLYLVFLFIFKDNIFKAYDINSVENAKYFIEYCAKWLSIAAGFIFLLYPYFSKKIKTLALIIILTTLVIAVFRARRGLIFLSIFPLLMAVFLYILNSRNKMLALTVGLTVFLGFAGLGYKFYSENENGFFSNISGRIDEDTRSNVEECLYNDFKFEDWILGRGFEGRYFCPNIDSNYEVVGYRSVIETGYLNIILNSGGIYLALLLALMIPAIFKGWFQSKNILSKAAASWIFFWLLTLYPTNLFAFSMNYLLVWIAVGICFSERLRLIPDEILKRYFTIY